MNRVDVIKDVCVQLGLPQLYNSWVRTLGTYLNVLEQPGLDDYEQRVFVALFPNGTITGGDIEVYDTFTDFPAIGLDNTLYVTKDANVIYRYDSLLGIYVLLNDPNIVNPDAPEEGTVFFVDLATTFRLKNCTYNNGTAGVGATLTGNVNGQLSQSNQTNKIDNVTTSITLTPIILIKNQTDNKQNGIYQITQLGDGSNPFILTRIAGYDETSEIYPSQVVVNQGTTNALKSFYETGIDPVIGTDNIVYAVSSVPVVVQPLLSVKTVLDVNLNGTYVNGTAYVNQPGYGATITGNVNDSINNIENVNGQLLNSGDRVLVIGMADNTQNGDYTLTRVGNATLPYVLTRIGYIHANLSPKIRQWIVEGNSSTYRGSIFSVDDDTIANSQIGITQALVFTKTNNIGLRDGSGTVYISDGTDSCSLTLDSISNQVDINSGTIITLNGDTVLKNTSRIGGGLDPAGGPAVNIISLGDANTSDYSWKIGDRDVNTAVLEYTDSTNLLLYCTQELLINSSDKITMSALFGSINLETDSIVMNSATSTDITVAGGDLTLIANHIVASIPNYANDAAADADANLQSGALYKVTGNRTVFQKP